MRASAAWNLFTCVLLVTLVAGRSRSDDAGPADRARPLILAHYMPWFVADAERGNWGWHWTMNHFDPEQVDDGRRAVASHFYPLIGPYDSSDPHVIEYHLLLMKLAGIDGVIIDWYGMQEFRDYAILHRNTERVIEQLRRFNLRFAICYEDQTIPALVEAGRIPADQRTAQAIRDIDWLARCWFVREEYVHLDGRPVLLSFGHSGLTPQEWEDCLSRLSTPVAYFSEHHPRKGAAGAFDWPLPARGLAGTEEFQTAARDWEHAIPVAFPRFVDIYAEARLHASYGRIEDRGGATLQESLRRAAAMRPEFIQLATWNDWGEGTVIEPSREFGYRDLERLQRFRREQGDDTFRPSPSDLRLPIRLLNRRRRQLDPQEQKLLDEIAASLARGDLTLARTQLVE